MRQKYVCNGASCSFSVPASTRSDVQMKRDGYNKELDNLGAMSDHNWEAHGGDPGGDPTENFHLENK